MIEVGSMKRKQKGFTLTELAIVLGALGFLLGSVWAISDIVWDNYRLRRTKEDLFLVVKNVQEYYAQIGAVRNTTDGSTYGDGVDITAELDKDDKRLLPITMRSDQRNTGSNINHEFNSIAGGSFQVQSIGARANQFRITLKGLSKEACQTILMQFPILLPELGVRRMDSMGASAVNVDPHNLVTPSTINLPLTANDVDTWCPDNSTDTNWVSYDFTLRP